MRLPPSAPGSRSRALAGAGLVLVLACGPSPAVDELAEVCEELFTQRVAHDLRCVGQAPVASDAPAYIDSCVAIAGAPGSTLTTADIAACAAELETRECLAYALEPTCVGYGADLLYPDHDHPGTRPPGAACLAHLQCASGQCSAIGDACGQCQRVRERGQSCTDPADLCAVGQCLDGVCELSGGRLGEACIDYGGGDCQADLRCRPNDADGIDGTCVARGAAGAACEDSAACAAGLYCHAQVCAPLAADGAACPAEPDGCASGFCLAGVCGQPIGGLAEGADCSQGYCRPDLVCGDDRVCRSPAVVPRGGECVDFGVCQAGLYCHRDCPGGDCPTNGQCTDLPGPGEPCTEIDSCAAGAVCVGFGFDPEGQQEGVCTRRGLAGDACPCADQLSCIGDRCAAIDPATCG